MYDPDSGQSVLIAELKDAPGGLLPAKNALLYPDAFTDLAADVRLTITKAGLEQDVILREQPPAPNTLGLGPKSELQLLTEFFDPPTPREHVGDPAADGATNQVAGVHGARLDPRLTFGSMSFGKGRAFPLDGVVSSVPVQKSWERLEGRQFLIEAVPYEQLRPQLETLPPAFGPRSAQAAPTLKNHLRTAARKREVAASAGPRLRTAQSFPPQPGVVLDYYVNLNSGSNLTLQGDTTYYVTGPVILTGVTTIEGGTVVKYANSDTPYLKLQGAVQCQTGPYRPAFFTAKDDNTVGATIAGSSGTPTGTYATTALWVDDNVATLQHLRIAWAGQAIYYDADTGWPQELWHTQIAHCGYGVVAFCPEFRVYNALMDNVTTNFYTSGTSGMVTGRVEHLTSDTAAWLNGSGGWMNLYLTNSLLVSVANPYNYSGTGDALGTAADFQTVLAGRHYLASDSAHRNAGTTDIDARLRRALADLTTDPPALLSGTLTAARLLAPQTGRDTDSPDRGYHYPPLDFLLSSLAVNAATVTLTNGVAVGVYGTDGVKLQAGAKLLSEGDPVALNRLVHYRVAQEDTASANGNVSGALLKDDNANSGSEARLHFTESVLPGSVGYHFNGGATLGTLALTDCQLLGASLYFNVAGTYARTVALTNNVFARVTASLGNYTDANVIAHARHNLFWFCPTLTLTPAVTQPGWEWRDNCFVNCTVYQSYGQVSSSYNGYLNTPVLAGSGGNDRILTASPFMAGPLGPWYLASGCDWIDHGSRTATAAGLYHYTTGMDQTKEGTSTVDIGFHYVAVTPAECEVALSGGALSGSGTCYGWNYAYAKDGATTDPGWHNCDYTSTTEYLRADQGSSRNVSQVAYVPRVMSANWADGSWNGVFRQYTIYVTDSASANPADWGSPVATGEWYWPNRQERKAVSFPPQAGRYVYFRRGEAWGWYTRQDGQNNPGYANANEVWVYHQTAERPAAIDTDGEGLADWREDANGNGQLDAGETSVSQADTNGDGLNDRQNLELTYNVLVNDPAQDYGNEQNTQFETACAVLGNKVIVAWVDSNHGVYGLGQISVLSTYTPRFVGYAVSHDSGLTFTDQDAPPLARAGNPTDDDGDGGDPVLAVDTSASLVYLVGTSPRNAGHKGIPLWKSTDGGVTFGSPSIVAGTVNGTDKPWIAVDNAVGTGQGDLYLLFCEGSAGARLCVSTDAGVTWGAVQAIADASIASSPIVVVGPDHYAYMVWFERAGGVNYLKCRVVENRGTSLGAVRQVCVLRTTDPQSGNLRLKRSNAAADLDAFRVFPFPVVAVSPLSARAGHLYVAYADKGDGTDKADIFLRRSTDGGNTWIDSGRVNGVAANDQWMPVLCIRPDGNTLFLAWYDRRNDPNNSLIEVYGRFATIAADGSLTFGPEFRVSTASFSPVFAGTTQLDPGEYDPVYPPGGVNLHWYYPEWVEGNELDPNTTAESYAGHVGEYNGAWAGTDYLWITWTDYRGLSAGTLSPRHQADVRLVKLSWPQ